MVTSRIASISLLLFALALLLGIVTTGCSETNRDNSSISSKNVTFVYWKEAALMKVANSATTISVEARDADEETVYSKLATNEVKDQYDETTQQYEAITSVDVSAAKLIYTFTHTDAKGAEVFDGAYIVSGVEAMADGTFYVAKDTDTAALFCKFYSTDKREITEATVQDQFTLAFYEGTATAAVEVTEEVEAVGYDSALVKQDEKDATLFTALAKGTAEFSAKYGEVIYENIGSIQIVDPVPEVHLYVCPTGYSVNEAGELVNDSMKVIEAKDIPPTFEAPPVDGTYDFVVVNDTNGYFSLVSEGVTMIADPAENATFEGCTMTANKAGEIEVTAAAGDLLSTNSLTGTITNKVFICPTGYSVNEAGNLLNDNGKVIEAKDIPPTFTAPNLGYGYSFVVVEQDQLTYTNVTDRADVEVTMGTETTVYSGVRVLFTETGNVSVKAILNGTKSVNSMTGAVRDGGAKYYICPDTCLVKDGQLYDGETQITDIANLPTTFNAIINIPYTFVVVEYSRCKFRDCTDMSILDTQPSVFEKTGCTAKFADGQEYTVKGKFYDSQTFIKSSNSLKGTPAPAS